MITFKCKMCGGDLEFEQGSSVAECPYCGSRQTLPRLDDDKRANLYDRANHFRRQNEYDKAMSIYEQILQEDRTDAEAYWSLVLCRYGIEYVEDPASRKRVPTVNRVQYTSILADEDYKNALQYADAAQRSLYEDEAGAIAEIQKGILDISRQEKPFDVFICYKETDANGRRTPDSVLANDLYHQLTNEGFKVFFSRITLEDKIGSAYEPYIFAALNSAKVMVVLGTKPEYFKAVWVKNEWSRYLALIRAGADKVLVPAYRDMDPYDLPEEFAHLQAQDMGKLGFMQDLIRGIKKITAKDEPKAQQEAERVTVTGANIENLMKRVRLFMEDGDFSNANDYLDKVLDEDAEYAPAYAAKTCTALGFRREAELGGATFLFEDNADWQKALRFATPQQKVVYEGYAGQVTARVNRQIRDYAYDCAIVMATEPKASREQLDQELAQYRASCQGYGRGRADGSRRQNSRQNESAFRRAAEEMKPGEVSERGYQIAAEMFRAIGDAEAEACAESCLTLAEQARQKAIYDQAMDECRNPQSAEGWELLSERFMTVPDFNDARSQADACLKKAEDTRSGLYINAQKAIQNAGNISLGWKTALDKLNHTDLDDYQDVASLRAMAQTKYEDCLAAEEEAKRQAMLLKERQAKEAAIKRKRNAFIGALLAVAAVAVFFVVTKIVIPKGHYDKGVSMLGERKWDDAIEEFQLASGFADSTIKLSEAKYSKANDLFNMKEYTDAMLIYSTIIEYSDAGKQYKECVYQLASINMVCGNYEEAASAFLEINDYKDAPSLYAECIYMIAMSLYRAQDYDGAYQRFALINDYKDVGSLLKESIELRMAVGNTIDIGMIRGVPIKWTVIGKKKESTILLSNNCLGTMAAGRSDPGNNLFFEDAGRVLSAAKDTIKTSFSLSEYNMVSTIALLDKWQVEIYLPLKEKRISDDKTAWWTSSKADYVDLQGYIVDTDGEILAASVNRKCGIRPAITIPSESLKTYLQGATSSIDSIPSENNQAENKSIGSVDVVTTTNTYDVTGFQPFEVTVETDEDGRIVSVSIPENYETPGLGAELVADTSVFNALIGQDVRTAQIDVKAGVTLTSNAINDALSQAALSFTDNTKSKPTTNPIPTATLIPTHSPTPTPSPSPKQKVDSTDVNDTYNVTGFQPFKVTIKTDENGKIISVSVPESNETPGFGADLIADSSVFSALVGQDVRTAKIDVKAGVTLTSWAINDALSQAALSFSSSR